MASLASNSGQKSSNSQAILEESQVGDALDNIMAEMREIFKLNNPTTQIQEANTLATLITEEITSLHIKTIINNLPIYIIVGHSSLELNLHEDVMKQGRGTEKICTQGIHRSCFTLNDGEFGKDRPTSSSGGSKSNNQDSLKKWLEEEARFVIYPTPPGEWGGLMVDVKDEDQFHILKSSINDSKKNLISREIIYHTEPRKGQPATLRKNVQSSFIPGSVVPDKGHEFFGDTLTGDGFGIIKLSNINQATPSDLLRNVEEFKDKNNFYYITNTDEKEPAWVKTIRDKAGRKDEVLMSEIVKSGGPGFYITLSCSPYQSMVWPSCNYSETMPGIYPKHIPHSNDDKSVYFNYWTQLNANHQEIKNMNDKKWEDFFEIYPGDRQRGREKALAVGFNLLRGNSNSEVAPEGLEQTKKRAKGATTRGYEKAKQNAREEARYSNFGDPYRRSRRTAQNIGKLNSGGSSCNEGGGGMCIIAKKRKKKKGMGGRRKKYNKKTHKRRKTTKKRRRKRKKTKRRKHKRRKHSRKRN